MSAPIPMPEDTRVRDQPVSTTPITEDTGETCRICRGEATTEQPLFYPCKCSGSIKYVHQTCLMEWLSHSQKKYCELCKTPFRFTKLYDQSMPEQVPWLLFGKQVVIHSIRAFARWARYSIVTFIWLCWLPWTIRQIWRALFWIADGSWLSTQELEIAVQEYGSNLANTSTISLSDAIANTTVAHGGMTSLGLFSTMVAIFSLLDPHTILRFLFRSVLHLAIWPTVQGEPIQWEGTFLFAPMNRPPSLLSDLQTLTSATRFPILNNAILDVLEGQLVCLSIVTAFILVFLIREWVINQQPLINPPEEEQPANPPVVQLNDEQRRAHRRRRRALRQLANDRINEGLQLENRDRPIAQPRPRRRATENNILVPTSYEVDRPPAPQRAQSLVPALQEMEDHVRSLADFGSTIPQQEEKSSTPANEPPPLQRGTFDEVGQIRRAIEETPPPDLAANIAEHAVLTRTSSSGRQADLEFSQSETSSNTPQSAESSTPFQPLLKQAASVSSIESEEFANQARVHIAQSSPTVDPVEENKSDSDTDAEPLLTPPSSQATDEHGTNPRSVQTEAEEDINGSEGDDIEEDQDAMEEVQDEPIVDDNSILGRLSRWLWHTDDIVLPVIQETEIVANIDAHTPVALVPGHRDAQDVAANLPAIPVDPHVPQAPAQLPVPQAAINNDLNAIDDAEDLEGVLELLGMEGPIAGMVQNIIFGVFLITLTLSASVWCPYIWGKITLLFVAHPFSVFIKAPLFVLSKTADFIIDLGLLMLGLFAILLNNIAKVVKLATLPFIPRFSRLLNTDLVDKFASSLSQNSGARLERSIAKTLLGFRPDLPTFSVQSHHVLRVFSDVTKSLATTIGTGIYSILVDVPASLTWQNLRSAPGSTIVAVRDLPKLALAAIVHTRSWFTNLQHDLRPISFAKLDEIDYSLIQWSASEKIVCIIIGYILFTTIGYLYMKICRRVLGLKQNEKVPGMLADILRQAGGVIKVIVIIGIEMILFPLYCGTMLDFALLPLFEGATPSSRLEFFTHAPLTALFIHWFLGTCYMFHFALFVSMCRKLMRKGVLYFIRDPDDPSFHPVRDVLERPVATQLGKIAFSAFVYGSLLVICLGGVVSGLDKIGQILPIRWGAPDTSMVIPGDIIFYNFMLPFILRKVDVSKRLSEVFGWWFKACAAGLRLSDFLFGVDNEDEKKAGTFLWKRFIRVAVYGNDEAKHPMVKHIENLSNHHERLLWLEAVEGIVNDEFIRDILGFAADYKITNLIDDRSEALIEFGKAEDMTVIRKAVETEVQKTDSRCRVKFVKEIKVEVVQQNLSRNTPIDTKAGSYVRAPAKDSVRIPKGTPVFVYVDEKNKRLAKRKKSDAETRLHGRKDDRFSKIYIPNHFRARISAFIALIWFFVAVAGLVFTIGPLLLGRSVIHLLGPAMAMNDLYAITIGIHIFGAFIFAVHYVKNRYAQNGVQLAQALRNNQNVLPFMWNTVKRLTGLLYLAISLGFVIPMALSMLAELYVNVPAYTYLAMGDVNAEDATANPLISTTQGTGTRPVIHILQTWAMGLLYLRILLRFTNAATYEHSRPAIAIKAITRSGLLRPDIKLATRALVLPTIVICVVLLTLPVLVARLIIAFSSDALSDSEVERAKIYCYTYPAILALAFNLYTMRKLLTRIEKWRVKIRDEVYLIGEKLHNFQGPEMKKSARRAKVSVKGKGKLSTDHGVDLKELASVHDEMKPTPPVKFPGETSHEIQAAGIDDGSLDRGQSLDVEIDSFRESTGLDGLPVATDMGDFSRRVLEAT